MRPIDRFLRKPKSFWASVRSLSQKIGYSKGDTIIVPSVQRMATAFDDLGLDPSRIMVRGKPTLLAKELVRYFTERARVLVNHVEPRLMDAAEARALFEQLREELNPTCPIPMNKQRGDKRAEAYLTGLVNMMVEHYSDGLPCNYDPRELTTVTRGGAPLRTLARRVDGAFPSAVNPVAGLGNQRILLHDDVRQSCGRWRV